MTGVVVGRGRPGLPEAELEWAAEIWRANPPIAQAVSLADFIAAPHLLIEAHLTPPPGWDAEDPPPPLLPAQRLVVHRLMLSERVYGRLARVSPQADTAAADRALPRDTVLRDAGYIEPIRHHAYSRSYHPERRRR